MLILNHHICLKFMRYLFFILIAYFLLFSCGPSKEEMARQKRIEDSLLEVERNHALEKANKLLDTAFVDVDTMAEQEKIVKK